MPPRRAPVRRNANDNVEPKVSQDPVDPLSEKVSHVVFKAAFQVLAHAMTTQTNRELVAPVNPKVGMPVTRVRDFTMINPPKFHDSKVDEDPQKLIKGSKRLWTL
uniref:Gag-pol polyprotein n=1 Tax=Solanum tuberosum TaxID=4113 RepID=M1DRZ2_SOLTU